MLLSDPNSNGFFECEDANSLDENNEAVNYGDDKRIYFDYIQYLWKYPPSAIQKKEEIMVRQLNTDIIEGGSVNNIENRGEKTFFSNKQVGGNAEKEEIIDRENFMEVCETDEECKQNGEDYRLLNCTLNCIKGGIPF